MAAPPAVAFRDVSYDFGGVPVLRHLDLAVATGETLVLLGRSGSGKTTALRMVNGLLHPGTGDVFVEGRSTRDWNPIALRRRIGYVIQEAGLFPHISVARNVAVVPELEGWDRARIDARVDALLTQVGLPPDAFRGRAPRQLSGGQRQRVGVARALAAGPSLLLLDEPFGALDPVTRRELQKEFLKLRAGTGSLTSLFVTHDVREALALGTRIALLHAGTLEFLGTPREFLAAQSGEALAFRAALDEIADAP